MTEIKNEQKVLLLKSHELDEKYTDLLSKFMFVVYYEKKAHQNATAAEVFARAQCFVLDMSDSEQRMWYAQQKQAIKSIGSLQIVYLMEHGKKTDIEKTKKTFGVNFVVKYLPDAAKNAAEFLSKMLADHIPSDSAGCLSAMVKAVKDSVSCVCK